MMSHPSTLHSILLLLRSPDGCPWDREQSHLSLAECLREETAEVLDAVAALEERSSDSDIHLCEELGDLWLQVVFHACLAKERGAFDIHDVESMAVGKLIRRHPHVFGDARAETSVDVLSSWQKIKDGENNEAGLLENMPASLSSLDEAMKVGRLCAKVGFDWPDVSGVLEQVREEFSELADEDVCEQPDQQRLESEFGDVLFSLVQWARYKKIDPDIALRRQLRRFKQRFRYVEAFAREAGGWDNVSLDDMEAVWQGCKDSQAQSVN